MNLPSNLKKSHKQSRRSEREEVSKGKGPERGKLNENSKSTDPFTLSLIHRGIQPFPRDISK